MMIFVRAVSAFFFCAGIAWFAPAAYSLFLRHEMNDQNVWHRLIAGCAIVGLACLVAIYDQLVIIARQLSRSNGPHSGQSGGTGSGG